MEQWLSRQLDRERSNIHCAFLFGSILNVQRPPRDVDIVVVAEGGVDSASWLALRKLRDEVVPVFKALHGLPLSMMIVTRGEWREVDGVVVRGRRSV